MIGRGPPESVPPAPNVKFVGMTTLPLGLAMFRLLRMPLPLSDWSPAPTSRTTVEPLVSVSLLTTSPLTLMRAPLITCTVVITNEFSTDTSWLKVTAPEQQPELSSRSLVCRLPLPRIATAARLVAPFTASCTPAPMVTFEPACMVSPAMVTFDASAGLLAVLGMVAVSPLPGVEPPQLDQLPATPQSVLVAPLQVQAAACALLLAPRINTPKSATPIII